MWTLGHGLFLLEITPYRLLVALVPAVVGVGLVEAASRIMSAGKM